MSLHDAIRARARGLGRLSLAIVPVGIVLQVVSVVQQFGYLFDPMSSGEFVGLVVVFVVTVVVGIGGVGAGLLAASTRRGRRTGAIGAALGAATLILFLLASAGLWNALAVL